jgi:hypothetical protein
MSSGEPSWSDVDVDDGQEARLREEWRAVPSSPVLGAVDVQVPKEFVVLSESVPR